MIFSCADISAFHMPDWKFSEGAARSLDIPGSCSVKLGNCMKKVENHSFAVLNCFTTGFNRNFWWLPADCLNAFLIVTNLLNLCQLVLTQVWDVFRWNIL